MLAAKKIAESKKILHDLVPLNSLAAERFAELSDKIAIETVKAGQYLFRKGDRDNQTFFLLEGTISLIDGFRKVAAEIHAGSEQGRHPISNLQPRQFAARAVTRAVIARIDSGLLDVFLTWDPSSAAEVVDIGAVESSDWMTRMLQQSKAFIKLPPSLLQALLMKFKPIEVSRGDVIIAQGSEGEHFYTIHEGRCVVSRRESPGAPEQSLAELSSGDSFGEEALVSECTRNASVTMLTDGLLMRLAKQDFVELLKTQLVKYVDYSEATRMVEEGAVWVDVRTPEEYECGSFDDSVNIPLSVLRGEMPELVYNAKYVICCDTGSRSDSAAFVLSHRGFDVCVLSGGMSSLQAGYADQRADSSQDEIAYDSGGLAGNDLSALMNELVQERQARQRVEQQLVLARDELAESGERLAEYYGRVHALEDEKRQSDLRHTSMREKHAEQLRSISRELEREKMQSHRLSKTVGELQAECESLRRELGSEQEQSESQYLQLKTQLDEAMTRAANLEAAYGSVQSSIACSGGQVVPEIGERYGNSPEELEQTMAEAARLRAILESVSAEKHAVDMQVEQLTRHLDVTRESLRRMAEHMSNAAPGDASGIEE